MRALGEFQEGDRWMIRARVPGGDSTQLEISVDGPTLTLRAKHTTPRFQRVYSIPAGITPSDVRADCEAGVVTISMPIRQPGTWR
ncbi:unannotated protein [freshwater metagenome]|uniref:Unannotated protein n=1 Tax=freshwater metagenome TaxID=449393 RepID=A0A6J6NYE8_9ZZZZ